LGIVGVGAGLWFEFTDVVGMIMTLFDELMQRVVNVLGFAFVGVGFMDKVTDLIVLVKAFSACKVGFFADSACVVSLKLPLLL
jgi:L-asparagine transporter-like permease